MEQDVTEPIDALCLKLSAEVESYLLKSGRRSRTLKHEHRQSLRLSVSILVKDALISHATHPYAPVPISKRPETYLFFKHRVQRCFFQDAC